MHSLLIERNSTLADFEAFLKSDGFGNLPLLLPNSLATAGTLGCSLGLTQLILTWARRCPAKTLHTFLGELEPKNHSNFVQRVHGLAAAYFADEVLAEKGKGGDIRSVLLEAAHPRILAMHQGELGGMGKGSEIEVIFIEGARHEFHGSLYSKAPTAAEIADPEEHGHLIRPGKDLNRFLERCFKHLNVDKKLRKQLPGPDLPFGSFLAEAFRNTADHGYLDEKGQKLHRNLRCVRIARTQTSRDLIASFQMGAASANESARKYFSDIASKASKTGREHIDILELSIFDSGKGYSRTMGVTTDHLNISATDRISLCFEKHRSAKIQKNSGVGLFRMLTAVHALEGFLRVRTSSAEAFYAASKGFSPEMDPKKYVHGGLADIEGTLITVGIPVFY